MSAVLNCHGQYLHAWQRPGNDDAPSAIAKRPLQSRSIKQLAFSFNGGKDSTVLLHLLRAALEQCRRGEVEGAGPVPGKLRGG